MANSLIQRMDGVKYDALGKAIIVAECLEEKFNPSDSDYSFWDHYNQVRQGLQLFQNTSFNSSIKLVSDNKMRKIIKHLKPIKASGYDWVSNSMIIKQLPCHFVDNLITNFNSAAL